MDIGQHHRVVFADEVLFAATLGTPISIHVARIQTNGWIRSFVVRMLLVGSWVRCASGGTRGQRVLVVESLSSL